MAKCYLSGQDSTVCYIFPIGRFEGIKALLLGKLTKEMLPIRCLEPIAARFTIAFVLVVE